MLTYVAGHEVNKIHRLLMMSEVIEPVGKMEVFSFIFSVCMLFIYYCFTLPIYLYMHFFSVYLHSMGAVYLTIYCCLVVMYILRLYYF